MWVGVGGSGRARRDCVGWEMRLGRWFEDNLKYM